MNWWETVDWTDPINRDCPLNAGILGWWMGAPGLFGGTRLWDLTNRNHGTFTNMNPVTAWQISERGPVISFLGQTGANNYHIPFTDPVLVNLPSSGDFTVCIVESATGHGSNRCSVAWNGTDDLLLFPFDTNLGNGFRVRWVNVGTTPINENGAIRNGEHSFLFTSRGDTDHEGYVDGVSVGTSTTSRSGAGPFTSLRIGNNAEVPTQNTVNNIRCFILFARGMSTNHVTWLYYNVTNGFPDMLNHYRRELIYSPLDSSLSINKELQILWNSLQLAVQNMQIDYNINLLSSQNDTFIWNNKSKTVSEQILSYHILSHVSKDFGISYDILQLIIQDISYLFNTLGPSYKPVQVSWNDLALATKNKDLSYNILSKITNEIETIAHVRGLTASETQILWNVLLNLSVNKDFTWNTLYSSPNSIEMLYNIRTLIEKDIQSLFNTRKLTRQNLDYIWDVIGPRATSIVFEMLMYIKQNDIRNFYIKKQELHDLIINTVQSFNLRRD